MFCLRYQDGFGAIEWAQKVFNSEEDAIQYARECNFDILQIVTLEEYHTLKKENAARKSAYTPSYSFPSSNERVTYKDYIEPEDEYDEPEEPRQSHGFRNVIGERPLWMQYDINRISDEYQEAKSYLRKRGVYQPYRFPRVKI